MLQERWHLLSANIALPQQFIWQRVTPVWCTASCSEGGLDSHDINCCQLPSPWNPSIPFVLCVPFHSIGSRSPLTNMVCFSQASFRLQWGCGDKKAPRKHTHDVVSFECGNITTASRSSKQVWSWLFCLALGFCFSHNECHVCIIQSCWLWELV